MRLTMNNERFHIDELSKFVQELRKNEQLWHEGAKLEFKRASEKVPEDMWETYSAFGNGEGGIILLGVEDSGKITGVTNASQLQKSLEEQLNWESKCSINLCTGSKSIVSVTLDDKKVLAMRVPPAPQTERPVQVYCKKKNMRWAFKRCYSSDVLCTEEEYLQMLRDRGIYRSMRTDDGELVHEATWDDLDKATIQAFRDAFRRVNPNHPWNSKKDEDLLDCFNATYSIDGKRFVTLAGLLMFGRTERIMRYRPNFQLDYIEYASMDDKAAGKWKNHVKSDSSWACNLFNFFFRVLELLLMGVDTPFILDSDMIRTDEAPLKVAVREALANALVHADYSTVPGRIFIVRDPMGLELSNPGTSLVDLKEIWRGGKTACRNRHIQLMFSELGVVERAGSGGSKILDGVFRQCLNYPMVREDENPRRVVWTLPYVSLVPRAQLEKLRRIHGNTAFNELDIAKKMTLLLLDDETPKGHSELLKDLPFHSAELSRYLSDLTRSGYLHSIGVGRATRYLLCSAAGEKKQVPLPILELPYHVQELLTKKRRSRPEMEKAIMELCRNRWVTSAEMSALFERNADSLQQRFLSIMVSHRMLELRYPESKKHPQQAYRTLLQGEVKQDGESHLALL